MAENIDGGGSDGADDLGGLPTSDSGGAPGAEGGVGEGGASVDSGHAPAVDGDAALETDGQGDLSPVAASGFTFLGKQYKSLAEIEAFHKSQAGRVPELQRKEAEAVKQLADLREERDRAFRTLALQSAERGQGGAGAGAPAKVEPKSWADELNEGGDLKFVADQMREASVEHGIYALVDMIQKRTGAHVDRALSENVQPLRQKSEFDSHVTRVFRAMKSLSKDYPEFDEATSDSPDAEEARQEIIGIWKSLPRELSLGDPERSLKIAVREYREAHGLTGPNGLPGSSGSPSAGVTDAAEAARAAAASGVVDGSGTPRPRPNGGIRPSAREQFEREMLDESNILRDPSGESLGFRRVTN